CRSGFWTWPEARSSPTVAMLGRSVTSRTYPPVSTPRPGTADALTCRRWTDEEDRVGRKLLKTNDLVWLFAESHRTLTHVGMLATFRRPTDEPTFVADLVARWRATPQFAPPFNYLFKTFPVPSWVELETDQIDLDYHLRHSALPSPGSQRELG